VAGNTCSLAFRASTFAVLQAQANRGDTTDFEMKLKRAIPADCFECTKHQELHTKHVHCTMDCGGNQGVDILHPERSPGVCFEGCKAGVDIAKLINDVINDIHSALNTLMVAPTPPLVLGGSTIATNYSTVHFTDCANPAEGCPEECDHPDDFSMGARTAVVPFDEVNAAPLYYEPLIPPALLDTPPPAGEHLNIPAGRNLGLNEGRLRSDLRKAAADADPLQDLRIAANQFAAGKEELGNAFADLSVTGHKAFAKFSAQPTPGEAFCLTMSGNVRDGCRKALDRAYKVANFLRTGERGDTPAEKTRKTNERRALGWIAVSGEDDSPHRPVNVPSSDYPQYNVDVIVESSRGPITVRTRYVIAQSQIANPNSPAKNLAVISMDVPSSGYSENLDFDRISPLSDIGKPLVVPATEFMATGKTPLLDFIENSVVDFAETLHQKGYLNKYNIKAVMGGSLGGNMTFRLGRRQGVDWLPKFVVWSPASIWNSLGLSADPLARLAVRKAWEGADKARNSPGFGDRAAFFGSWDKPIVELIIPMAQSDTWTSDYYPCKKSSVAAARLDRQETYDPLFFAWHWRLGAEQLIYSHQTIDPMTNKPRYMSNVKPMLLGCGLEDHVAFNDICPATMNTAPRMTLTPGKAIFMDKTGHSLDNERRSYWALEVYKFLFP